MRACREFGGDKDGCQAFVNNTAGYCEIFVAGTKAAQVAARLRGVLFEWSTSAPFTIGAVVQAD